MQLKGRIACIVLFMLGLAADTSAQVSYWSNFLASDGVHYLCAEGGGGNGSVLVADRTYPGAWETFEVIDKDGGDLLDGDHIVIKANSGHTVGGYCTGQSPAFADGRVGCGPWGGQYWHFYIFKAGGSGGNVIASGDQVIMYYDSGWSLIADWGGGSTARIGGTWGPHETFTITF